MPGKRWAPCEALRQRHTELGAQSPNEWQRDLELEPCTGETPGSIDF